MKIVSLLICSLLFFVQGARANEDLGTLVVTPNRYLQSEGQATSGITVIDQQAIAASNAATISDLFQGQLGINVYDNSTPKTATVDIRGYGEFANRSVLVLVNNRKVNPLDTSGPDWLQIPLETVERIEIVRGAGSVLYGDNAVGGVINIITKKGKDGLHGELGAEYGSYATLKKYLQLSGKKGPVDFLVHAQQTNTDGYRDNSRLHANDFDGQLGYKVNDAIRLDLTTSWHEDKYGLPAAISGGNIELLGRRATTTPEDFAKTKDRMVQLNADIDPWAGADLGKFDVDVSYRNRDTYGAFYSFSDDVKSDIDTWGVNGKYILQRQVNGHDLKFTSGVDYYTNDDRVLFDSDFSPQDEFIISKDELGVYGSLEYEVLDHLFLTGGSRYQKDYYTFNHITVPDYTLLNPDAHVNMGEIRYQYAPDSNVFANIQQTFRFLSTDEWYSFFSGLDTTLKQQKGIQYETGVKHNFNNGYRVNLTAYDIMNKNEISFDPTVGAFGVSKNYDQTRRLGVELGQRLDIKEILNLEATHGLAVFADYTFEDAEFEKGNFKGKRIPMTSLHQLKAGVDVGLTKHLGWNFSGHYVGNQFAINDEGNVSSPMEAYTLFDTKLTLTYPNWVVFGGINNIFEQKYYIFVTKSASSPNKLYYPAPERSFTVGMKVKF